MKALVLESLEQYYRGCEVRDQAIPRPGPGKVLIRVESAALNYVDLLIAAGLYQTKPPLPFVLGSDVAGYIEALGQDVEGFVAGEAVMGMQLGGAFAEYAVLPASVLKRKPENYTFSQAAAFGSAYFTAYVALSRRSHIQSGQWLLVHGAAGGVGLAAVDLGHALGLQVIASSASARKRELIALEYRPTALLDPSGDFREHVLRITNGAGADAIFDPVGGDVFDKSLRCVAFNGEYLVVGFTSGRIPHVPANIPLLKGFSIVGVRAGEYMRRFPDRAQEDKQALWTMARTGVIRPRVHAEYSLLNWRRAFDAVTHREVLGRVVLKPSA